MNPNNAYDLLVAVRSEMAEHHDISVELEQAVGRFLDSRAPANWSSSDDGQTLSYAGWTVCITGPAHDSVVIVSRADKPGTVGIADREEDLQVLAFHEHGDAVHTLDVPWQRLGQPE